MPDRWLELDYTGEGIYSGEDPHGTAIAEIIYDIAPEAELVLLKIDDMVDFERAKDLCIREEVDIVNYSASWLASGFGDGQGLACDIVNDAEDKGIFWVNSAGNYAQSMYTGFWTDIDADNWHNFNGDFETLELQDVKVGETINVIMTWNDWPRSSQDYDLYLFRWNEDGENFEVASSTNLQFNTAPVEAIEFDVKTSGKYTVFVRKSSTARTALIKIFSKNHEIENYASIVGSIGVPADARGAYSVGAIHHWEWRSNRLATYSSQGPTVDGRIKPDIVAPSAVNTASYGTNGFYGTSSAAPHVAGVAALIKSAHPSYKPAQLKAAIEEAAVDIGSRGRDNAFGVGKLAIPFLQATSVPSISSISPTQAKIGDVLTVRGEGFGSNRGSATVVFSPNIRATSFVSWTDTQIRVRIPQGTRTGNVFVLAPQGQSNTARLVVTSPYISSTSSSRLKSGDSITLTGGNFGSVRGTSRVEIGSTRLTEYSTWTNTRIVAQIPTNARTGNLLVRTGQGASNSRQIQIISPYITSITPTRGEVGDMITITGGNFSNTRGTGYVSFGTSRAVSSDYVSWTNTRIVVRIPVNAVSGDVKVNTTNGSSGGYRLIVESEQIYALPELSSHGYYPPTTVDAPKSIKYKFDGIGKDVILTFSARDIGATEAQIYVNGVRRIAVPESTVWSGWMWWISSSYLRSGENIIEFRNTSNTSRSNNYQRWEIRDAQLWKQFSAKLAAVSGLQWINEAISMGSPYPTPFNSMVHIPFILNESGPIQISIYNLLGQRVRNIETGFYVSGPQVAIWDGKDNQGKVMASGLYIVVLESQEARLSQILVHVK